MTPTGAEQPVYVKPNSTVSGPALQIALQSAHVGKQGKGTDQGDPLAALAAAVANLSPADRAKLAAMLIGN